MLTRTSLPVKFHDYTSHMLHVVVFAKNKQANFKKIVMPRRANGAFSVTTLIGLVTLTFDLLTSK